MPWGAVVLQDFAIRIREESLKALAPPPAEAPPQAELRDEGVAFMVTGQASPGDHVRIADTEAEVSADGTYRATVVLQPGENLLSITATSPGGTARFFRQRIDAVQRQGGWLIAPRAIEPQGVLRLPAGREEEVPSGTASLRVEAPEGTRVRSPRGEVTVGPQGEAEVAVTLTPGRNTFALELVRPGEAARKETLEIVAAARPFAVGLLDLEGAYSLGEGDFQLHGRGAAHVEAQLGELQLLGEVDLRDTDFRALHREDASSWLRPRLPERFERSLDPERSIHEWGDTSTTLAPNASEGRLRVEARHEAFGRAGLGTYRALMAEGEMGRYHQPLFGPFAELKTEAGPVRVGVNAFAGSLADPTRGLATRPAHEELQATGGSLYFLGATAIAEGSELLRVELRDGLTGLPLAEQHLVRGKDYEIDYLAGRIFLARPLSFMTGGPWLRTDALTTAPEPVLVADYAAIELSGSRDSAGGEAWAEWGGARAVALGECASAAPELRMELLSRTGAEQAGGIHAGGRGGSQLGAGHLARCRSASRMTAGSRSCGPRGSCGTGGDAAGCPGARPGPLGGARWTRPSAGGAGLLRWRAHARPRFFRQAVPARRRSRWGPSVSRCSGTIGSRRIRASRSLPTSIWPRARWAWARRTSGSDGASGARSCGMPSLRATEVAGEGPLLEGGRTSVGLQGPLRGERLAACCRRGHRQALLLRGEGPGRVDDTFSSAGVDVQLDDDATVGVRGGWGPGAGAAGLGERGRAPRGQRRLLRRLLGGRGRAGLRRGPRGEWAPRRELDDGTSVFVEDVGRARRERGAPGAGGGLPADRSSAGCRWEARYERGVRNLLDVPSSLTRDSGGPVRPARAGALPRGRPGGAALRARHAGARGPGAGGSPPGGGGARRRRPCCART